MKCSTHFGIFLELKMGFSSLENCIDFCIDYDISRRDGMKLTSHTSHIRKTLGREDLVRTRQMSRLNTRFLLGECRTGRMTINGQ